MSDILKPSLYLAAGRTAAFAVTFCIPLVLVRTFDQSEFGTYKQLFLVFSTAYAIGQVGMAESLFYFLPKAAGRSGGFVANSLIVLCLAGAACFGLLVLGSDFVAAGLENPVLSRYLPLLGAFLALSLGSAGLEVALTSRGHYRSAAWTYFVTEVVKAACLLAPALLLRDLRWVLVGAVVFGLLRLAAAVTVSAREFRTELRPDWMLLRSQLTYAAPFGAAVILEILRVNWHQYAVASRFDVATFAIYAVGCLQIPLVDFVASPACNVMMVKMREALSDGRRGDVLGLWHDTVLKTAALILPLTALLIVCGAPLIVFLFTEQYRASVPIFLVWVLILPFAVLQTDGVLRVFARTRFLLLLHGFQLVWVVVTIGAFIAAWGLPGAALATALALAVAKVAALLRIRPLLGASLRELLPWGSLGAISAASALAAGPVLLLELAFDLTPAVFLGLAGATYGTTYALLLALLFMRRGPQASPA